MATLLSSLLISLGLESGQFKSGLDASTKQFKAANTRMKRDAEAATQSISNSFKTLSISIGAYFSGREMVGLLDSFTRLQNNLRVAGLEGEQLKSVQDSLFAVSQRYGTNLEELSSLLGKVTQSQKELGASQSQLIALTTASAQALRITGTSTQAAQGALLGMSQALSSGTVRAEEYNQMLEGGLQPLLQVVANTEKYGGSLGKLRAAVVDGKVSSKEFFDAILAGSGQLEEKAAKAALTLSGGYQTLTNALTVYFGEADKANGVSVALGGGLQFVGNNLQTIIPLVASLGTAIGVGYVTNLVRARLATIALTAANAGLMTSMGRLGLVAGTTRIALLAAFGGPVGIAITTVGAALYYVSTQATAAEAAAARYAEGQAKSEEATKGATDAIEKLAFAHGRAREEAIKQAQAERENIKQKLASAQASLQLARAEAARQEGARLSNQSPSGSAVGSIARGTRALSNFLFPDSAKTTSAKEAERIQGEIDGYTKKLDALQKSLNSPAPAPAIAAVKEVGKAAKGAKSATDEYAKSVTDLRNELFPEVQALEEYRAKLALIDQMMRKNNLTVEQAAEYRRRLALAGREENSALGEIMAKEKWDGGDPIVDMEKVGKGLDDLYDRMRGFKDKTGAVTVQIAQTFADMAQNTINAFDRVANAIKGGGFLDILGSVIGLGMQLGSAGVFGKSIATTLNTPRTPGFANGTRFAPGGLAVVGERGRELVNLPRGSQVIPNRDLSGLGGGGIAQIVPSPYFDVVVDGRIVSAAPSIMNGGSKIAQSEMARTQNRMLR
jgi:tape measure domain-containing protein